MPPLDEVPDAAGSARQTLQLRYRPVTKKLPGFYITTAVFAD